MPCALKSSTCSCGLCHSLPTTLTPLTMIALRYRRTEADSRRQDGRVSPRTAFRHARRRPRSSRRSTYGVAASAPSIYRARRRWNGGGGFARPTHVMPPWTIRCSTPNISVKRRRTPSCSARLRDDDHGLCTYNGCDDQLVHLHLSPQHQDLLGAASRWASVSPRANSSNARVLEAIVRRHDRRVEAAHLRNSACISQSER